MVFYEVNLRIDADIATEYRLWLAEHIQEMLSVPGFVDAEVLEVIDPAAPADRVQLSVRYRVHGMAALQDYFEHRAAKMREAGMARFGGRFQAERRILQSTPLT
ncbi:hypothetical protein CO611_06695 [Lysobacteraceae bacterium NML03-0222]|nr:hypothetical protein CO611_06695 [Xanthomonadaceae bacterium NML03-0222]